MQFTLTAASFLALVASSLALQVTSPAQGSSLDLSKDNKITWASVSTDPSSFSIVLVNNAVNPSVNINIASNVQASSGSYDLKSVSGVTPGQGFQINLVSTQPQDQGILAQSAQFTVTSAGASTTSASFSSSTPSGLSSTTSSTTSGSSTLSTTTSGSSSSGSSTSSSSSGSSTSPSSTTSGSSSATSSTAASTGAASTLNTFTGAGLLAMVAAIFA